MEEEEVEHFLFQVSLYDQPLATLLRMMTETCPDFDLILFMIVERYPFKVAFYLLDLFVQGKLGLGFM